MSINMILKDRHISKYKLSKLSQIPYSTIQDICAEKTALPKCSAETIYKLAKTLDISMETLLRPYMESPKNLTNFRSEMCHRLKRNGDIDFMISLLQSDDIRTYWNRGSKFESLYLLGMLDYLCHKNQVPECTNYNDIRCHRFEEPIFPVGINIQYRLLKDESIRRHALDEAIPEFLQFGIVEKELYDAV